jgi:hypothetical protein
VCSLDWAITQNSLGVALATIGESGTARLEEAVAAYRAALKERTRGRVPLGWAMTPVVPYNFIRKRRLAEGCGAQNMAGRYLVSAAG